MSVPLAYLRSDADRAYGVGWPAVLVRETAGVLRDMGAAARRGSGSSRVRAPYWMARRLLGAAGRPLDGDELVTLDFATPTRPVRVCVRKNQSDLLILWQIFLGRFYELGAVYRLDRDIDTLGTIVDLGGNTGLAAAYLTARYRPHTLLTVEPIAESRAVLERNAGLSGLEWRIDSRAVSGEEGELDFVVSGFWDTCTAVPAVHELRRTRPYRLENVLARPPRTLPATTVDRLLRDHGIDHVDLLKVDVEGTEADVFAEPRPWMDRVDRIVLEVHDKYIDGHAVRTTLRKAGFREVPPRRPQPRGFNPVELYVRADGVA
ncbi:FkbM family methyltransferase [Yinghuangia seranimata]|uniref:FkbM family methyltransferase n=1 Tax=Yinghuangia seranimata TaxID=408067 RepID=UPI00248BE9AC|nr:FkbM family methyltransferase [Yinghuangia seranimata]MDI2125062.1 FkbM family methyltransferase [Yinghuangia seranimata]